MDLKQAAEQAGSYFLFEQSPGIERLVVYVGVYPKGIVIVDSYWTEPGGNPFHIIPGVVIGEGPWTIRGRVIRAYPEDKIPDNGMYEAYLASEDGKFETRERAKEIADKTYQDYIESRQG